MPAPRAGVAVCPKLAWVERLQAGQRRARLSERQPPAPADTPRSVMAPPGAFILITHAGGLVSYGQERIIR